jgi:hypothetical protein
MDASPKEAKSKRIRGKARAVKRPSRGSKKKPAAGKKRAASDGGQTAEARSKASAVRPRPKLLSGGNPQISKGDGDAPAQAYIAAMPGWKRDIGRRLDALITHTVPRVRKAVRWNSPFYGVEGRGWFLTFHCFAKYIKVTFLRGMSLRPLPPVESKHPDVRYFHIYEGEPLDEKLLARWIGQAAKRPGDPLF